ncbi:MAG: DUF4363 family protein [Anaerovoracaceae bacterium]
MKSLIISVLSLSILITIWCVFYNYSDDYLHSTVNDIDNSVMIHVEDKQWKKASKEINNMEKGWHKYKRTASFFLDTESLNETDYSFAKCNKYIKAKDVSNSAGEVNCLKEQLLFLHKNESLIWSNIF